MDLLIAAPFLRGLALHELASGPADSRFAGTTQIFVRASPLPQVLPADAVVVDIPATTDEAGLQELLRGATSDGILGKPRSYALRQGECGLFLTVQCEELPGPVPSGSGFSRSAVSAGSADLARSAALAGTAGDRHLVVGGKAALVTGGAQGFGEEIVRGLAASGATVYIADLNKAGAEALAGQLNAAQGRTAAYPLLMDVSNEESVAAAFDTVARTTGGLDLVVSNAGVLKAGSVLEQGLGDFEFVTKVNYTAFFLVAKYAGRMMKRQHSGAPSLMTDIIQINSKSGLEGSNKNGAYAGSKFGGLGLVQSFALELVEYGIKVNAICPGNFFDGPLWSDPDRGLFVQYLRTGKVPGAKTVAEVKAFYEAKVPMRRGCEGPDVMKALFYLVEQKYETGQALPVTGGQVMLN